MGTDERLERRISGWLEETAPQHLPERVFDATFERTRRTKQHVGWRAILWRLHLPRVAPALGGTAVVVIAGAIGLGLVSMAGVGTPEPGFAGRWEGMDPPPESSHLTMDVSRLPNGTYDVTIRDDFASVCDGAPSTMTGIAEATETNTFVIEQPVFSCDDGSQAQALSGPPLEDQLRNLTFVYRPGRDEVEDSFELIWSRASTGPSATGPDATDPGIDASTSPEPTTAGEPSPDPSAGDDQPPPFVGTWTNDLDADGGHQTMDVAALPDDEYRVTVRDDLASVCAGAPSTMTGVAQTRGPYLYVIDQPEFVCDDGSEPAALSGRPLEEQLQNLAFVHDPDLDEVRDSLGGVWTRATSGP